MRQLLAAVTIALGAAHPAAGVYLEPVEAKVVASTARVEAGKPFDVGVLLRMQRGWHVYWRNPGDAGLPTSARWAVPAGFTVGPLSWPVPRRFEQPGGVVGYGYADTVLLRSTVTPPAAPAGEGPVALRAEVGWLACESICIRGKKSLDLTLGGDGGTAVADPAVFAEWAPRFPVDAGAAGTPATVTARGGVPADGSLGGVTVTLDWKEAPASTEWFPPDDPALAVEAATSQTNGARTLLTFRAKRLPGQQLEGSTLESVVAWTDASGARHGLRVPIDLDGRET
jgi:DsbC/DsbD-like thiol-disulfide interchange protein